MLWFQKNDDENDKRWHLHVEWLLTFSAFAGQRASLPSLSPSYTCPSGPPHYYDGGGDDNDGDDDDGDDNNDEHGGKIL